VTATTDTAHHRQEPRGSGHSKPRRVVAAGPLRVIAADRDTEAALAWDLAEAVKPHLNSVQCNYVYVRIGIGETFAAIHWLITSAATTDITLPIGLIQRCRSWLNGYAGHPQQQYLGRLVERVAARVQLW
jgi:hypothetical protein